MMGWNWHAEAENEICFVFIVLLGAGFLSYAG